MPNAPFLASSARLRSTGGSNSDRRLIKSLHLSKRINHTREASQGSLPRSALWLEYHDIIILPWSMKLRRESNIRSFQSLFRLYYISGSTVLRGAEETDFDPSRRVTRIVNTSEIRGAETLVVAWVVLKGCFRTLIWACRR